MTPPKAASSPEAPASLHDHLVRTLREMIVRGELGSGQKVPEARLCETFGVSRTPLREALKALSVEGLITLRPNRGAVITPLDPAHLSEVFEAKGALEHFIGLQAAQRADADELDEMDALHERLTAAEAAGAAADYTALNDRFHLRMAQLARNGQIIGLYTVFQAKILRARHIVNEDPARVARSLAEHGAIMAALRARARLDLAERLVEHNTRTAEAVIRQISEAAAGGDR